MDISYHIILPYQDKDDQPFLISTIEAFDSDKKVGYLHMEWLSSELIDIIWPTAWHWVSNYRGSWYLGLTPSSDLSDPDTVYRVWKGAHRKDCYNWQEPAIRPSIIEMLQEMEIIAQRYKIHDRFETFKQSLDHVYVRFSRVDDGRQTWGKETFNYQGLGIGSTMYQLGAMWLAVYMNRPLHSSTLRSDSAAGLWDKLIAEGYPIYQKRRPETNKYVLALDYTLTPFLRKRAEKEIRKLPTIKSQKHLTVWPLNMLY